MFPIILVFILRESVERSDNPTSRLNMNMLPSCSGNRVHLNQPVSHCKHWHFDLCEWSLCMPS